MPRTPILSIIQFTMFVTHSTADKTKLTLIPAGACLDQGIAKAYRRSKCPNELSSKLSLTSRATHLYVKGWIRWLPDSADVLVGIAVGEPHYVRAL